jgi:Ankyrin repeats (3 copies)/SLBB domain
MKTRLITLVLFAIAVTGFADLTQGTNQPVNLRRIDPRAMQMQMAVLKDQDLHKIEELLKQGLDINAPIGCGTYSPLDGAVDRVNLDMLKFLLAHGAKPRGREIVEAAFIDNPKTALNFVKVLLSAGVDPNSTNNNGGTAISNAAYEGNRDLVVLLLAQPHIKVDVPDGGGWTALMYAADHGSLDIEDMLVKAGADARLKNSWGQTATDMAERSIATRKSVKPYVYVSGGVVKTGCYHWVQGMTVLDAIHAAGGFTNFVSGPIFITHLDGTAVIWDYPPAMIDATNEPPVLSRDVNVYVYVSKRIF